MVRLWGIAGDPIRTLERAGPAVSSVAFVGTDSILWGNRIGQVKGWTETRKLTLDTAFRSSVSCLAAVPGRETAVAVSEAGVVKVLEIRSGGTELDRLDLGYRPTALGTGSSHLAVGRQNSIVEFYRLSPPK